jgi:hypothetical protein
MNNIQTNTGGAIGCLGMIFLVGVVFVDPFLIVLAFPMLLIGGGLAWIGQKKGLKKEAEDVDKQKDVLDKF